MYFRLGVATPAQPVLAVLTAYGMSPTRTFGRLVPVSGGVPIATICIVPAALVWERVTTCDPAATDGMRRRAREFVVDCEVLMTGIVPVVPVPITVPSTS